MLNLTTRLKTELIKIISETNGLSLNTTLDLMAHSPKMREDHQLGKSVLEFRELLAAYSRNAVETETLLRHPMSQALFQYLKEFPIPFHEEHIHLSGSLTADFVYPRLMELLNGPNKSQYEEKIREIYGEKALPIKNIEDVDRLIRLQEGQKFFEYLRILMISKFILNSRQAHADAAYHMAKDLYNNYNVGNLRLKFTMSRITSMKSEQIPGLENLTPEDVVMGLYDGLAKFKAEHPGFGFVLSPSFRKEVDFYDKERFKTKKDYFENQINLILEMIEKHPELKPHLSEIDTVGDEKEHFRKAHFEQMKDALRTLQFKGFTIRSHHGETWNILRHGLQAVDNAMDIWQIDTLEHGLSLGINPNYYFHRIFQKVLELNAAHKPLDPDSQEANELEDMHWPEEKIKRKLLEGKPLTKDEIYKFSEVKFNTAREMERYQHDLLNRMLHKGVTLISLPSSNLKLTQNFPHYKDHPFSWWEKKGVHLGVGTDNYVTLSTNLIQEMLILLYADPDNLKITKLLMVATRETRRPYLSNLVWEIRKKNENEK